MTAQPSKWPKELPGLTDEQQRIREDFYTRWLTALPQKYGVIEKFNHGYPLRNRSGKYERTLDIGAGRGEHLRYEDLSNQEYTALELRPELAEVIRKEFPEAQVIIGDCQEKIDAPDGYFDRVMAIHVLEHLPNLPKALDEIRRVLSPVGRFYVLIPCEGGMAYTLARNISARPMFERQYNQSYDWFIACEHINRPHEILPELTARFAVLHRQFFPLFAPIVTMNLVIGLTLMHRK